MADEGAPAGSAGEFLDEIATEPVNDTCAVCGNRIGDGRFYEIEITEKPDFTDHHQHTVHERCGAVLLGELLE